MEHCSGFLTVDFAHVKAGWELYSAILLKITFFSRLIQVSSMLQAQLLSRSNVRCFLPVRACTKCTDSAIITTATSI